MRHIDLNTVPLEHILLFDSINSSSACFAEGSGDFRIHVLEIKPGGHIGLHPAGFAQILIVTAGSGYACGQDGVRYTLRCGEAAFIERGEMHAKGSESGMKALMIQVSDCSMTPNNPDGSK